MLLILWESIKISPENMLSFLLGRSSAITLSKVDLPQPEAPKMQVILPLVAENEMSFSIVFPRLKENEIFFTTKFIRVQ